MSAGLHAAVLLGVTVAAARPAVVHPPVPITVVFVEAAAEEMAAPAPAAALPAPPPLAPAPAPVPRPVPARRPQPTPKPAIASAPAAQPAAAAPAPAPDVGAAPSGDVPARRAEAGELARPRYAVNPAPEYPATSRRRHEEGLVLLRVQVTSLGRAQRVELARSCGHPALDDAALRAVRDWSFEPARIGSVAVDCEIEVPVRFALRD